MKKKLVLLLQIMIVLMLISSTVYAAISASLDLRVSKDTVKQGEEVEVTLSLKNVANSETVSSVSGYINYNKNIIEEISVDSIVKDEDNTVKIGNEVLPVEDLTDRTIDNMPTSDAYVGFNAKPTTGNDSRIVIDFKNGITSDEDLLTVKFKVKTNATTGEIENAIEYKLFVLTVGSESSEEITKNVKLTIETATQQPSNPDNTPDNTPKNNPKNNTVNNTTPKNTSINNTNVPRNNTLVAGTKTIDNTVAGTTIPAAGAKVIIIPAVILILCAYISYNRYMKYKQF